MAPKKEAPKEMSTADMLAQYQKDMGASVGSYGGSLQDATRIPTGIFPLDLAMGGGIPRGKCTILFGPYSSGKTNVALLLIARHQKMYPHLTCIFFDIENSFDPVWAAIMGVDVSKLVVVKPSFGEQLVDMAEGFMYAPDSGLIVIDSLAAIISTMEVENSATKQSYGGNSILIGKLCRKTTLAAMEREKQGNDVPTLVYINQVRNKLGVMFGSPEDMPGGEAPRFQTAMWVRLYGKNLMDNKVSQDLPVGKETTFIIKKWKCPIVSVSGKFDMMTIPNNGFKPGEVDDWPTISEYLKNFDQFNKHPTKKAGWLILDEEYPTIQAFRDRLYAEKDFGDEIRQAIIQRVLQEVTLIEPISYHGDAKPTVTADE